MFIQYEHHGKQVWVRDDLRGKHWGYCLCAFCAKLNVEDRGANCPRANELYEFDVRNDMVTPVWECLDFEEA